MRVTIRRSTPVRAFAGAWANIKDATRPLSNKLHLVSEWVLGRRPRVWATLYLLLIPIAGIIFSELPVGSFYDTNLTREAGFQSDLDNLQNLLTGTMQYQENGDYLGRSLPNPKWTAFGLVFSMDPANVYVQPGTLNVDASGNITFNVLGFATASTKQPAGYSQFAVPVTLTTNQEGSISSLPNGYTLATYPVSFAAGNSPTNEPGLNALFPLGFGSSSPDGSMIEMPPSTALVIDRLSAAGKGDPKYASGLCARMFYFSATTITTLGFGDITPVTSLARLLVGLEAIAGVVLIGFFLNAVARK